MSDRSRRLSQSVRRKAAEMWDVLPAWPRFGRAVDLPVYVVHVGRGADQYFFAFDFEAFAGASGRGVLARPVLQVWAGRDDFDRAVFALDLRKSFAEAFDEMRSGRLTVGGRRDPFFWLGRALAHAVLAVALGVGQTLFPVLGRSRWRGRQRSADRLEAEIDALRGDVDDALRNMEVLIHPQLRLHAVARGAPGDDLGGHRDAWPLPDFVVEAIAESGATPRRARTWW